MVKGISAAGLVVKGVSTGMKGIGEVGIGLDLGLDFG